jgi:hypothetical protein
VAQIDPFDDSVLRYVIRRHQYDPETKHFRWFYESAFDNKREYKRKLLKAFEELEVRQVKGEAHLKEQLAGEVMQIGNFRNSKSNRQKRAEEGRMYLASPRNRVVFLLLSHRIPFVRSRRIHKFLRGFLK